MKRSEFISLMGVYMTPEGRGDLVAELERENGVKWDPEEPDLPKLLEVRETPGGPFIGIAGGQSFHGKAEMIAVFRQAVDAYNRLQSGEPAPQDKSLQAELDQARLDQHALHAENRRLVNERIIPLAGALHDIAKVAGVSDIHGPKETAARIINEFHERNRALTQADEKLERLTRNPATVSADIISKTRRGKTVHYAIGPARDSRVEAERDLREWFDKERS